MERWISADEFEYGSNNTKKVWINMATVKKIALYREDGSKLHFEVEPATRAKFAQAVIRCQQPPEYFIAAPSAGKAEPPYQANTELPESQPTPASPAGADKPASAAQIASGSRSGKRQGAPAKDGGVA